MKNEQTLCIRVRLLEKLKSCFTAVLSMLFLMSFLGAAQAQSNLFWNPQGAAGPSDGSGNWDDTTVSNWFNGSSNVTWSTAGATNAFIGAGVPGIYNITNLNTINASSLTFSNANGYTVSGAQLTINAAGTTSGLISLSNTTNTIAAFYRTSGGADITNAPNSELILTGGGSSSGNPRFEGVSQANSVAMLNGGTYAMGVGTMQISGTTLDITNAIVNGGGRVDFGRNQITGQTTAQAASTVNVFNGGQLNANTSAGNNSGNHLQLSRGAPSVVNVYPGGVVTTLVYSGITIPNVSPSGNLRILPDSGSQGTLNVLGGSVLVGLGGSGSYGGAGAYSVALSMLTFFDAAPGVNANSMAILNMTGGSITANQVAFTTPGSVSTSPTNGINITGGTLYVGAPNISYPVTGTGTNFFFNLSGGTVSAIQNWSPPCPAPIKLTNVNGSITFQAADINGSPFNMAFSGALKGVGGFYKTGGGALTLSGANNYSGATVVSNGTLVVSTVNSPLGGDLTLEGDSLAAGLPINSVVVAASGQFWSIGNLTYDTGAPTIDFNYGSFGPSTTVAAIQVNGNLVFNVTPQVTIEGSGIAIGTYPLITYTGTLSGTPPTTALLSNSYSGYVTNITTTKTIALVIISSPVINGLTWAVGSGVWDTSTQNWTKNGSPINYTDPNPVAFNDSASGPFPITVTNITTVSPESITVISTNNYSIIGPGVIAGGGSVTKSGSGTLTLSGTNTYTGGTTIELGGGTLSINYGGDGINNSAIGTGPLTLKTGAKLDNTSGHPVTLLTPITQFWNDDWTFLGTTNLNLGTAPITLGNGQVVLTVASNILEVDGQIGDGGLAYGIQKQGNGTLTLSNLNTFSGGMDIEAGTVNINSDGAIGSGTLTLANNATIDNASGAPITLNSGPSSIIVKGFMFLGTSDLDLGAAAMTVQTATVNVSSNTLYVEGALNGSSTSLTKTGAGALTLGGNASSGSVTFNISAGTVNLNRASGFIGINTQGATVNTNAALVVLSPTGTEFNQSTLTLNGGLVEWNGDNETLASVAFNSGILRDSNPIPAQLSLVSGDFLTLGGIADFDITNGATLTINGIVAGTGSSGALLKTGAGSLILASNTTYTGNTTISNGTLSLTYPTLATNSTVAIATGAVLNLNFANSDTNTVGMLVLNGTNASVGLHDATTDSAYITGSGSLLVTSQSTINPTPGTIQFGVSGNTLNLAWPTNAGWLLQAETNPPATGINSTNWVTLPGSDSITNLSITVSPTNGPTFYRLIHP
jgi:autotransporter-associated beta strand protein